ncbi:hypothetical protein D3C78_987310 [compost metagenome]
MFGNGAGKHVGGVVEGGVPIGAAARQAFAQPQLGVQRAGSEVAGQVQGRALAAQLAKIGRVRRVAADTEDLLAVMFDQYAAAYAAVTTGRGGRLAVHQQASCKAGMACPFSTRGAGATCGTRASPNIK